MVMSTMSPSLLDLPQLAVYNICHRLSFKDAKSLRLSCRTFYNVLFYPMLQKTKFNLKKLEENDLNSASEFLEYIDFGKHIIFKMADCFHRNSNAAEIIKKAKNLNNFKGDMSWTAHVSLHCPSVKSLDLKVPFIDGTECDITLSCFLSYQLSRLRKFESLRELHIEYEGELSVRIFDHIFPNAPHLNTFGLSKTRITHEENNGVMRYVAMDEMSRRGMIIEKNVSCWIFLEVWVMGFKLIIPNTASTITILSSNNIAWDNEGTKLKQLKTDFVGTGRFVDTFPDNVEHCYLNLPGWTLSRLYPNPNQVIDKRTYKHLTVASYFTSKVIDNIVSFVSAATLTKIHLFHVPVLPACLANDSAMKNHNPLCNNEDVVRICRTFPELNILVLENQCDVNLDLISELLKIKSKLQLLRLIGCHAFQGNEINDLKTNMKLRFQIELWETAGEDIFPQTFPGNSYFTQI